MVVLTLGPVTFEAFELPGQIRLGGRQRLAEHALPGGGRVIDALGRDDAPLSWSGVFSGPDAAARALTLDLLRAEGAPWPLAWDVFAYTVVISEFRASYQRQNWIPYSVVCTVVQDDTAQPVFAAAPLLQTLLGDLTAASAIGAYDLSAASVALGAAEGLVPGTAGYSAAGLALGTAVAGVAGSLASAGNALNAAPDFPAAAYAAQQCAALAATQGFVQRAQTNLANAGN